MKTFLCVIYNSATGHHSPPLIFETKEQAMTTLIAEVQAPNSELANIKDQLSVHVIGRFDHKSGRVSPYLFKKLLISGSEITLTKSSTEKESL